MAVLKSGTGPGIPIEIFPTLQDHESNTNLLYT